MKSLFIKSFDPFLKKVSQKIPQNKINTEDIKKLAELMIEIIEKQRKKKKKGVGLAAPQIGIFKRIILVDTQADGKKKLGKLRVFINPEIIWKSKKKKEWYEGCFSTGNICGIVSRPTSIKIQGFEASQPLGFKAKWVEEKYTGYVARIFQHEIDHLNGQVFTSHIKDPKKLHWVKKKELPIYRKTWKNWPKKYPLPLDTTM